MRLLYHAGATRTVLVLTAIATTLMGHAIRTDTTVLPGHIVWWGLFWLASWSSVWAALRLTPRTIGFAGWAVITVFVSRAVAVILNALFTDARPAASQLLAVAGWMLLAYYAALVFNRISHRQEA